MENINLIWQTQPGDQTTFEMEYTTEVLFKNFSKNNFFDDGNLSLVMDNSVIIYSNNSGDVSEEFKKYLERFVEKGYKFYLLHWSNENLGHNTEYYKMANHVFRPYFDSNIQLENVTFIPLGFKTGFLSNDIVKKEKIYNFSFIGQPKSDREELINLIKDSNSKLHLTNQWNCPTSLSTENCLLIYGESKFVPCPMGWVNPDSYRIMEALESGSIPILKNYNNLEYFKNVWGITPLPVVNNWDELEFFKNMSDEEYDMMYNTVHFWYKTFKNILSKKIEDKIKNSTDIRVSTTTTTTIKEEKLQSLIHIVTPLYRKNNIRIIYPNIFNLTNDFNWHLIEGSNTVGEESLDFLKDDKRVHLYKIETQEFFGHEQRNFFIKNIKCEDNDWCYFLDDDNIITQDLIEVLNSERHSPIDVILFSQKKGLTEGTRLYAFEGHMSLGNVDIGSFAIRYGSLKNTFIPFENQRNSDGHYAEQITRLPNVRIKYFPDKYVRYNSLAYEIV